MSSKKTPERGIVRQGDVLLVPLDGIPVGLVDVPRVKGSVVLAEGEATGHAHAISSRRARLLRPVPYTSTAARARFLLVEEAPVTLRHEEHDPITLAPGAYQVVRQREYVPAARSRQAFRWVAD